MSPISPNAIKRLMQSVRSKWAVSDELHFFSSFLETNGFYTPSLTLLERLDEF